MRAGIHGFFLTEFMYAGAGSAPRILPMHLSEFKSLFHDASGAFVVLLVLSSFVLLFVFYRLFEKDLFNAD